MYKFRTSNTIFLLFLFLGLSTTMDAQIRKKRYLYGEGPLNNLSVEFGFGLLHPQKPSNDAKFGESDKIELGLRYKPDRKNFGARLYYGNLGFEDNAQTNTNNLKIHRIELQGLYILNDALGISNYGDLELESYIGLGAGIGNGVANDKKIKNRLISGSLGLRPRYLIDREKLFVYFDLSYNIFYNQRLDYNGASIPKELGGSAQVSIGISYKI